MRGPTNNSQRPRTLPGADALTSYAALRRAYRAWAGVEKVMSNYDSATNGGSAAGEAKKIIGQAGETLKAEAQSFASVAGERMWAQADKAAQAATKTIGSLAQAVRRVGEELASNDQTPGSRWASKAASGLDDLSGALSNRRPEELLDSVRGFARRNPALFVGGAVLMGVALGRFLRAAEGDERGQDGPSRATGLIGAGPGPAPEHGAATFTPNPDPRTGAFGADEAPSGVMHVDDGSSDPNAEPDAARPGI